MNQDITTVSYVVEAKTLERPDWHAQDVFFSLDWAQNYMASRKNFHLPNSLRIVMIETTETKRSTVLEPENKNKLEQFAKDVVEIICNAQNVGYNRVNVPFVDPADAFAEIARVAMDSNVIVRNPKSELWTENYEAR